jgi:uncharacterized protein YkwD
MNYDGSRCPICHGKKLFSLTTIGVGMIGVMMIGIIGLLFVNGTFEINEKNLNESIKNTSTELLQTEKSEITSDTSTQTTESSSEISDLANERKALKIEEAKQRAEIRKEEERKVNYADKNMELIEYALQIINEDRKKFDLQSVTLSENQAAQIHAEDILKTRMISHWMTNGEKPYMTYTRLDGTGYVSQNVGFSGFADPEECTNYNVICEKIVPFDSIAQSEYGMMYDDASSDWGHRDNILQPYHTHVSLGIAYDDYTFAFVQNFEDNYLVSNNPISVAGNHVTINSELKSGSIQNIGIFYDSLPTSDLYFQHRNDGSYGLGDNIAVVVSPPPPNSFYNQPLGYKLIEANRWSVGNNSVLIDFDLSPVLTRPGVYTVGVWVDEGEESFMVTSYSIFHTG